MKFEEVRQDVGVNEDERAGRLRQIRKLSEELILGFIQQVAG